MTTEVTSVSNHSLTSALQYREDGDLVLWEIVAVASPIVIFVGLTGNAVGAASLLRVAGLRHRGMGHLLVAICVSDAIFLVSLLPTWLGSRYGVDYDLYNSDGWCQLLSLTTMSSNFLSTWFTVALGIERYVAVRLSRRRALAVDGREGSERQPASTPCGPTRTRVAIVGLTVLAVVVFVNMVVNIGADEGLDGVARCRPLKQAVAAMRFLSNVDLVVNVVSPILIVVGLYVAVGVRLADWRCRRHRAISRLVLRRPTGGDDRAVSSTEFRLSRTAFLLSAVVVLLSTPSHAVRAAYVVAELFQLSVPPRIAGDVVQLVARELFRASFAVPFFVVVLSHSRIRRSIVLSVQLALESTLKKRWYRGSRQTSSMNAERQVESTVITSDTNR